MRAVVDFHTAWKRVLSRIQLTRSKSGQPYCLIYINAAGSHSRFVVGARWKGSLLGSFRAFFKAHFQDALGRAKSPAYRLLPESALFYPRHGEQRPRWLETSGAFASVPPHRQSRWAQALSGMSRFAERSNGENAIWINILSS
jgi:hypothetical protein